ncbi:MAG: hypothetical protein GDA53_08980 [Rhodobacteraceae bacterium]|nr:hypothetical protein [Paracoccaceae bacterium]
MAAPESGKDIRSRVVRLLRWILLAAAVVLLASVFVLSNSTKVRQGTIIADTKLLALASGQIDNPSFSGVTRSGNAFAISAAAALPDDPDLKKVELRNPRTMIDFETGHTLRTAAGNGLLNLNTSEAVFSNVVDLFTSNGYTAQSPALLLNFETGNVYSIGPVVADGPIGSIEAGSMTLLQNLDKNPQGNAILRFTSGVKLIYRSQQE